MAAPPIDWRKLLLSWQIVPLLLAAIAFLWLAVLMTDDPLLVAAFAVVSVFAVILFRSPSDPRHAQGCGASPNPPTAPCDTRLATSSVPDRTRPSVVVSVGLALAMLVVVLALEVNLRNEYLGASVFDVPTFVASDLFEDEVQALAGLKQSGSDISRFTATPMLRGALTAINGNACGHLAPPRLGGARSSSRAKCR